MFERIGHSFALARSSWDVLRKDKQLVLFPVISGIGCLLVLISFAAPLIALIAGARLELQDQNGNPAWWTYPVLFAFYFCNYFVIVFCNSALVSCALMRFGGQEPTLGDGFRAAFSRLPQIAVWSLVSATVGVLLKVLENAHERVGEFISAILGTAWTVLTYFVVPVLVVEKVGPFQAIRRSVELLKKTWGEALIGGIGLGLFKFLLMLPGILLLVAGVAICVSVQPVAIGLILVGLALLYLLGMSAVTAALDTIFLGALYQYAAFQSVPAGFDSGAIEGAFQRKKGT
jgi:hypothetical protein